MKAILKKVDQFSGNVSDEIVTQTKSLKSSVSESDATTTEENITPTETEVIDQNIYIQVDENNYIKFETKSQRLQLIDAQYLRDKKIEIEKRLAELEDYSDENLLAWAKKNYPTPNMVIEVGHLQEKLTEIINTLEQINV